MAKLTDRVVQQTGARRGQTGWREISDDGCRGLLLRVSPRGERVWCVRIMVNGKRKRDTIGAYPLVSLAEARERATDIVAAAREGVSADVLERRRKAQRMTLEEAHGEYLQQVRPGLAPDYADIKAALIRNHVPPTLKQKLVRHITRADLVELADGVKAKGLKAQVNQLITEVRACLRWCADRDYLEAVPAVPKATRVRLSPRDRTLSEAEIRTLWHGLTDRPRHVEEIMKLLLLTGQRKEQVTGMLWEHLDIDAGTWTVPPTHHKTGRLTGLTLVYPLATPTLELLRRRRMSASKAYVFPSAKRDGPYGGLDRAVRGLRSAGAVGDWVIHDLRRTMRTSMRRLGVPQDVCEACLGHTPPAIDRTYDRYDLLAEKREAFQRWADYVLGLVGERGENVVPFRGA